MSNLYKIVLLIISGFLLPSGASAAGEDVCECIKIKISAPDTLKHGTYLDYKFTLKNTCSGGVWVNTGFFSYRVYNLNNTVAYRTKELTFVNRYKYPEYVLIMPNAEYEFKFADDLFFEYRLERHNRYRIGLRYHNLKAKHAGRNMNFLCSKELKRTFYVK